MVRHVCMYVHSMSWAVEEIRGKRERQVGRSMIYGLINFSS